MSCKIFVSIAAWRDPFIINTVKSIYSNAYKPDEVTVGVIFQGYEEDRWMVQGLQDIHKNVKLLWVHALDAPINLCEIRGRMMRNLVTNEDYFLQIDSHTKMAPEWDVSLIAELHVAESKFGKCIIQGHSALFHFWSEPFVQPPLTSVPDAETFFSQGSTLYGHVQMKPENTLVKEKFFNANSVFSRTSFIYEVPQPDEIPFDWEQPIMSMRTWTAGYEIVSPTKTYTNCFDYNGDEEKESHFRYVRKGDRNFIKPYRKAYLRAMELYFRIFALNEYKESYGPMGVRSLEAYVDWVGWNPLTFRLIRDDGPVPAKDSVVLQDDELELMIMYIKGLYDKAS